MTEEQPDQPPKQQEQQEEDYFATPRVPFTMDRPDLINAHLLRNTEFRDVLINYIDDSQIYESAKRALKGIVNNYFSQNWLLANFERGGRNSNTNENELLGAQLALEHDLIFATCAMSPTDLKSSDMVGILSAIRSHFKPTLSRTKGPQREGLINRKITTSQEITRYDLSPPQMMKPAEPEKKRWSIFGRK